VKGFIERQLGCFDCKYQIIACWYGSTKGHPIRWAEAIDLVAIWRKWREEKKGRHCPKTIYSTYIRTFFLIIFCLSR